jgi:hypothetical protein
MPPLYSEEVGRVMKAAAAPEILRHEVIVAHGTTAATAAIVAPV